MAKHRRTSRVRATAIALHDELAAICADLCRRAPATSVETVEAAVRNATIALAGLDAAPQHVAAAVLRYAEERLDLTA